MKALWLRMAMCVPMYLFEHHLACDLVVKWSYLTKKCEATIWGIKHKDAHAPFVYEHPAENKKNSTSLKHLMLHTN